MLTQFALKRNLTSINDPFIALQNHESCRLMKKIALNESHWNYFICTLRESHHDVFRDNLKLTNVVSHGKCHQINESDISLVCVRCYSSENWFRFIISIYSVCQCYSGDLHPTHHCFIHRLDFYKRSDFAAFIWMESEYQGWCQKSHFPLFIAYKKFAGEPRLGQQQGGDEPVINSPMDDYISDCINFRK